MRETEKTKRDCFGYNEKKCNALNERYCDFEKCNFYKTKKEFEKHFNVAQMKVYSAKKNNS